MGFVSKLMGLFGAAAAAPKASAPDQPSRARQARNATVRDDWLEVTQPNFYGQAHRSPNRHWVVGCNDSDGTGHGGHRESGNGRVMLVDHQSDKVIHELTCFARPTDAAVSDAGNYIVHDCGLGSSLQGDVVAIGLDGRERYRRRYCANVFNIGLSKCGRYAAVQTANAPSGDGNLLEVLDLDRSCTVFSVHPETGWADRYLFDVGVDGQFKALSVLFNQLGKFRYSDKGEFRDKKSFQGARLNKGDYSTKVMAARDLIKDEPTPDSAKKALSTADAALVEGGKDNAEWGSIAHRVRGESYELLGQMPEALAAYEKALSLNPKVGVQKRATALRKVLGTG